MYDNRKTDVQRNLFDKFASVVIDETASSDEKCFNLPAEDLKHCEKIQKEFDLIIENLRDFKALCQSVQAEADHLEKYKNIEIMSEYLLYFPSENFAEKERKAKQSFIEIISRYFYKKYNLKEIDLKDLFQLENLSYKNLVDKIFAEFGDIIDCGTSNLKKDFRERFVKIRPFDEPNPPKLSNNKISLRDGFWYNSNWDHTAYCFERDNESYLIFKRALFYFETGDITAEKECNFPEAGYNKLIDFSTPYELNLEKIKAVKFYKNYRVDIIFHSAEYANEFYKMFDMAQPIDYRR